MTRINKARFWVGVLYPENMVDDWESNIGDILQLPYAYCVHSKDKDSKSEHRKDHVHIMVAHPNTTTYNHAMNVFNQLSADGKKALNSCQAVISVRNMYDYLIHDTETCKKNGKELYSDECRITGNNFDIGAYEQLSIAEKNDMCLELCNLIAEKKFINFMDFYDYVVMEYLPKDMNYFEILKVNSGFFERLVKGNYQRKYTKIYNSEMLNDVDIETGEIVE